MSQSTYFYAHNQPFWRQVNLFVWFLFICLVLTSDSLYKVVQHASIVMCSDVMETVLNKGEPREESWILYRCASSLYLMVPKRLGCVLKRIRF